MIVGFGALINGSRKFPSEAKVGYPSRNIFPEYEVVACR